MKIGMCWLWLGLLLMPGLASAQGCLGGASTQSTCVQSGSIYGQGNDPLNSELLKSDSAASTTQGRSANGVLHGGSDVTGQDSNNGKTFTPHGPQKQIGGALARRLQIGRQRQSSYGGGKAAGKGARSMSLGNSLGEHDDYFGNDAERDVHGHLTTCLHDSWGRQICM